MLSFIYFPVSLGLTISKNTGSDQKALYESMHPLAPAGWGFFCCNAANWGESLLFVWRGWPCWTDPLSALASLGESTALGKWIEKNSKFSCTFDRMPRWFWPRVVVQGTFCIWPLGFAEREKCLKSKFGKLGGKCQRRALALLTAFSGLYSAIAHNASASYCAKLVHLCSLCLHEIKGSKIESSKNRKLGLPSLLQFTSVYGTLYAISS